jgi:rubrerythrin
MKYAGSEVLQMAIEIEEKGRAFYNSVAETVKDAKAKEVFQFLADEEVRHAKLFKQMLDTIEETQMNPYDTTEIILYFRALIDNKIFPDKEEGKSMRKDIGNLQIAIRIAISLEKDSILFYLELLSKIQDKDHAILNKIVDEERDHIRRILKLKSEIIY